LHKKVNETYLIANQLKGLSIIGFVQNRFGETVIDVIEKTSKIDIYENKSEKYSALTPDIRIHYQTVFK